LEIKRKKNIAILVGGDSVEKKISIKSGKYFYSKLDKKKYTGYIILVSKKSWQIINLKTEKKIKINDFSLNENGKKITFDAVIILVHGAPGETGDLCSYFESLNIPYSSSNKSASKLTFNKYNCNQFLRKKGFTVPYSIINKKSDPRIQYPCIVKPIDSGSSFGVSKINSENKLNAGIELAQKYGKDFMIEEFINGRELTCAVHNFSNDKLEALPITEIISKNEIFDYNAKYLGQSEEITPAILEKKIEEEIKSISKNAYSVLKLHGIVRFDFIVKETTPYIIEVNTIPGFSKESIVPQMITASGKRTKEFISKVIEKIISN